MKVVNAAGFCVAHDPERPVDMRELGRKSGEARRRPDPERVPASLRQELQTLDPVMVREAIERSLVGVNESARVAAVKLLADVDALRKDGQCPECAARKDEAAGARAKVLALLTARAGPERAGPDDPAVLRRRVEELEADLRALHAEHGLVDV